MLGALTSGANGLGLHGDRHLEDKREIMRLEYQWRAAQLAADLSAMDSLLADDYVGVNVTGQVNTKAQLLNRIRRHDLTLSRIDLREIRIKLLGDVAVATVRADVQGTSQGAALLGRFRYIRIYHRLPSGAWKITNFEATRVPSHHDGVRRVSADGASAA